MEVEILVKIFISLALIGGAGLLLRLHRALVTRPKKLRSALRKQGISGPPPTFLLGNLLEMKKFQTFTAKTTAIGGAPMEHNYSNVIHPYFEQWQKKYGDVFMFSLGNTLVLHVTEHDMVRQITTCTSLDFGRPSFVSKEFGAMLGNGVLTSNGVHWAHQRKILEPEMYMAKVKGMIKLVQDSALTLISSWNSIIEAKGGIADIRIDNHLRSFSGDVISKACFGSNYSREEEIFIKIKDFIETSSQKVLSIGIPGMRYLPTKSNRKLWALEKEVKTLILKVVKERQEAGHEKDLLQTVLNVAKNSELSPEALDSFIIDNCKNIYLASYESTAVSISWCLMLLAANPEWQERVRVEVVDVCNGNLPDADMIKKMKLLSMVINESLRLYPPVTIIPREALKEMKIGNINIPEGVTVLGYVPALHTDPAVWGPDSYKFNPDRFANGIAGACKLPHLYMPFGFGPRVCLGQNLALVEMKILIALVLANFHTVSHLCSFPNFKLDHRARTRSQSVYEEIVITIILIIME